MPIIIPPNLILEKNKLSSTTPWLILLELTLADSSVLYFVRNTEDITYSYIFTSPTVSATKGDTYSNNGYIFTITDTVTGGTIVKATGTGLPTASGSLVRITGVGTDPITFTSYATQIYTAFPFEIELTKQTSKGDIPTISLQVSNVTRALESYLETSNGLVGQSITIKVVADAGSGYELAGSWTYDILGCSTTNMWVTFTLGAPNPLAKRFPLYKYMANNCNFQFRLIECAFGELNIPYTGTWIHDHVYIVRDIISPTTPNGHYYRCTQAGTSGTAINEPTWPLPTLSTVKDNTIMWQEFTLAYKSTWNYNTSYKVGDIVKPITPNGHYYRCTQAGTSHASIIPTWSIDTAAIITDNSVIWIENYCKRTLTNCSALYNTERFGGFPGMGTGGIKIVK